MRHEPVVMVTKEPHQEVLLLVASFLVFLGFDAATAAFEPVPEQVVGHYDRGEVDDDGNVVDSYKDPSEDPKG